MSSTQSLLVPALTAFIFATSVVVAAQTDEDAKTTIIQQIDLSGEGGPSKPNYILFMWDVKRLGSARAHTILRQLNKRVRVEVEGEGWPKGKYAIATATQCGKPSLTPSVYQKFWTELHALDIKTPLVASEKAVFTASLRTADKNKLVLEGRQLGFFHIVKGQYRLIDCKPIQ